MLLINNLELCGVKCCPLCNDGHSYVFLAFSDRDHDAAIVRWYNRVSMTLDAQSVASYMVNCQALDVGDLEQITSRRSEPISAAKQLLDIVRRGRYAVYFCFLDALSETGHQHVRTLIETGNSRGTRQECVIPCT